MSARKIANLLIISSLLTLATLGLLQLTDFQAPSIRNINNQSVITPTPLPLPELNPEKIIIPSLSLDLVVKAASVSGNRWTLYEKSASYLKTSAHLNENGNTVIYAHNTWNLFGNLKALQIGDRILLEAKEKVFVYSVKQKMIVKPDYLDIVAPSKERKLTLFTCTNFLDADRLVVVAEPAKSLGDILDQ